MEEHEEQQQVWMKRNWRFVLASIGIVALTVLMILGKLTVGQFLSAVAAWFILFASFNPDVTEITLGAILGIKRDVADVRRIREQVQAQAEEIRAIRDQVKATESIVAEQAQSIEETAQRVAESERAIETTKDDLQKVVAETVQAVYLSTIYTGFGITLARCEEAEERELVTPRLDEVSDRLGSILQELTAMCPEEFAESLRKTAQLGPRSMGDLIDELRARRER